MDCAETDTPIEDAYAEADELQEQIREYAELNNRYKTWRYIDALTKRAEEADAEADGDAADGAAQSEEAAPAAADPDESD